MSYSFRPRLRALGLSIICGWQVLCASAYAQPTGQEPMMVRVSTALQRLEMIADSSRTLTLDHNIPRAQVINPEVVQITPLKPNVLQLFAKKPGVTQINLWDERDNVQSIDVIVFGDPRLLQQMIRTAFPNAAIKVMTTPNGVMLSGYIDRPDQVPGVIRLAEEYFPKVINNMTVGGVQQVLLNVKVMEVSRTRMRTLGFDFGATNGSDFLVSSISGLISPGDAAAGFASGAGDTVRFGIVDGEDKFFGFLEALQQNNLAKILAEPKITCISGRPAKFIVGGEIPIIVPQSLGTVSIEYKTFGTQVDFVPIVLGEGRIRLEVRPQVSELDDTRGVTINNTTVPALKLRSVDTGVEMRAGQTLALAGLVQTRIEAESKGLPILADLPGVGAAFRRVHETNNEIELLIVVTPELVAAMEPHEVPTCLPGMSTDSPTNWELYWGGHLEVPTCGPCAPTCDYVPGGGQAGPDGMVTPEEVPRGIEARRPVPDRKTAAIKPAEPKSKYIVTVNGVRQPTISDRQNLAPQTAAAAPTPAARAQAKTPISVSMPPSRAASRPATVAPAAHEGITRLPAITGVPAVRDAAAPPGSVIRPVHQPQTPPSFVGPLGYDVE